MVKIANRNAGHYSARREIFSGSHLYSEERKAGFDGLRGAIVEAINAPAYVVFSYGEHFPLFAFVAGKWYENGDGYSVTTAKHRTHARPAGVSEFVKLDTAEMKRLCGC